MQGDQIVSRIKSRVVVLNIKMADFYRDCGISSGALSQWKSGQTQPSLSNINKIAKYLHVSPTWLLEGSLKAPTQYEELALETKIPDPVKVEDEEFIRLYQAAPQWLKDQVRALLAAAAAGDGAPDVDSTEP